MKSSAELTACRTSPQQNGSQKIKERDTRTKSRHQQRPYHIGKIQDYYRQRTDSHEQKQQKVALPAASVKYHKDGHYTVAEQNYARYRPLQWPAVKSIDIIYNKQKDGSGKKL